MHGYQVVSTCIHSGDGGWQVRVVDLDEKRYQDESLWDVGLGESQPTAFAISDGKGEAVITNQLHDRADNVPVR